MTANTGSALYRVLLRSFPRDFRTRFGTELESAFVEQRRAVGRRSGRPGVVLLWIRTVPTVLANGLAERWGPASEDLRRRAGAAMDMPLNGALDMLAGEIGRAGRGLWRAPRYTIATVTTFALVIGAGTLFLAVVDGVLLRPLPYPEPEELMVVGQAEADGDLSVTSAYALRRLGEGSGSLDGVAAFNSYVTTLTGAGDPVRLNLTYTTSDYFDVVGVHPALGRGFAPGEAGADAASVVIVSDRLWRTRFRSDPDLVGRKVVLDGWPYELIGVMPQGFREPDALFRRSRRPETDVWMPTNRDPLADGPGYRSVRGLARLADGATVERVAEEANAVARGIREEHPDAFSERGFVLMPLKSGALGRSARLAIFLLAVMVTLVVLVGCANVANLAVGRGLARAEAQAVRVALGARGSHLLTGVSAEVLLVGLLGGVVALGAVALGLRAFLAAAPQLPLLDRVTVDGRVAVGALSLTLLATLLGALLPSVDVARRAPSDVLGHGRRSSRGRWDHVRNLFAGFQVAGAVALLVGALLVHASLRSLLDVDRGFEDEGVWVVQIDLPGQRYADPDTRVRFTREAEEALLGRGGIDRVGFVTSAPQVGINNFTTTVGVEGWEPTDPGSKPTAYFRAVTPGYLETMGIALLRGRALADRDVVDGAAGAALVNREFALRYLSGRDPLGASLELFGQRDIPVVGLVDAVRYGSFAEEAVPEVYLPFAGRFNVVFLVARSSAPAAEVTATLRARIHALDSAIPMDDIPSLASLVARTVETERFVRLLVTSLAALVLALAAVGTYAVLAEAVARRARELGIRAALGADRGTLMIAVLARGGRVLGAGIAMGLVTAWIGGRWIAGALFGVTAAEPWVYLSSTILVGSVGLAACWLPALRATRADPLRVLQED